MKAKPIGMLWMIPTGWSDHLLRTTRQVQKGLTRGYLMGRMRKFTLLASSRGSFSGGPAGEWDDEPGRRQRLLGTHDPGGECRHLFGVGEGPTEVVAGAKQERSVLRGEWIDEGDRRQVVQARRTVGGLLSSWVNPSRSICNTICNSRVPLGYGWASVALRPAYGV